MLRDRELELDPAMGQLLERIRKRLYLILSVDELEHIERRYRSQVQQAFPRGSYGQDVSFSGEREINNPIYGTGLSQRISRQQLNAMGIAFRTAQFL